jgi:adenosine/AMP kinase
VVVHQANVGFVAATNVNTGAWLSTNNDAVYVAHAGNDGIDVYDAAYNGINAYGAQYAGYFSGNINVTGNCVGCLQANFAVNAGNRVLQPGDVVSVQSVTSTDFDAGATVWQVTQAQSGQAVVGVVAGRAELVTDEDHRPTETGKRLVPREGAAEPGEYVTIVYSGPMQVRIAPGESAIAAGTRLTAAAGGRVRPLQTRTVEGMVVTEGTPVIGTALESLAAGEGLIWVLVNPQ